jgi:hypothetical protein
MLAITMEQAVTKPMVRRGPGDFTEGRSATAVIVESTISKLSAVTNCFGVMFKLMTHLRWRVLAMVFSFGD